MMTKMDDKEPPRVVSWPAPATPSIETPRPQTQSIKSFLTPTNVKQQGGFATPTQSNQKGVWTVEDLVLKSITRLV